MSPSSCKLESGSNIKNPHVTPSHCSPCGGPRHARRLTVRLTIYMHDPGSTPSAQTLPYMDLVLQWPEPVVAVQSLSDSGITAIPEKYIRPPPERPLPEQTEGKTPDSIPVVDLGGLSGEGEDVGDAIRAVSDACKEWGFFQVVNHGVSLELIERMRCVWGEFFRLPAEEKKKLANDPITYQGYGSRLGVDKAAVLDWGDYFYLEFFPESRRNLEKWPPFPISCRETIEEYGQEVLKLCGQLMRVLSMSLGLDEGLLQEKFGGRDIQASMRVNYYPKCPQPDLTLGLSAHSDPGGLTVLLADDRVKGLQVRRGDKWVTVQPVPNAFLVNIADQIQVISNGVYKSVEHRVVANSKDDRLSIAFFYNPNDEVPIEAAVELVTKDRPACYQRTTFKEYRLYIRKKGPKGKSQVESMKAIEPAGAKG